MKKITSLIVLLCIASGFFLYITSKKSDWFSLAFISYDKKLWPKSKINQASSEQIQELQTIIEQPFYFLGSGNQTFAFVSEDGKYVLKFFKFQHLKDSWLPKLKSSESRQKRIQQVFAGHSLGFLQDKENSGIIFAHLDASQIIPLRAIVFDKKNSKHVINLDDVVFVLQRKGESSNLVLSRFFEQGDLLSAKAHIRNLLMMYVDEYKKGLFDRDHNVMHNTGFSDGRPLHIDVGKLRQDERMKNPSFFMADLKKVSWERIDLWMQRYYPEYRQEIAFELNNFLQEMERTL